MSHSSVDGATRVELPERSHVGRYRLAYELASGGMASIYMACIDEGRGFDKVVALKRVHPHLAKHEEYVQMFLDEARIASRIHHPNVASVIDFGEDNGEYFLAMEFLIGVPLTRVLTTLADVPSPPVRWPAIATRLIVEACEGLHAAHELKGADGQPLGVVHRDVSPQNLFVGFDGVLRVLDFGIAKAAGKLHVSRTGEMKGKVAYMSPEQLRGFGVDRRSDVWALGVVLWELLTFRRLFRRDTEVDAMYNVLELKVEPPSQLTSLSVPRAVDEVVLNALVRSKDERLSDTRTMARQLSAAWAGAHPVDAAEVADLLVALFPGEQERQRALVEQAREAPSGVSHVPLHPPDVSLSGASGVGDTSRVELRRRAAPSRRRLIALVFATFAVGILGGASVWALRNLRSDAASASGEGAQSGVLATGSRAHDSLPVQSEQEAGGPAEERAPTGSAVRTDGAVGVTDSTAPQPTAREVETPVEGSTEGADGLGEPSETATAMRDSEAAETGTRNPSRRRIGSRRAGRGSAASTLAEAAPAPSTAPGSVSVVVPGGWANVYDDRGRFLGSTPLTQSMPPGRHRLELRFYGEPPPVALSIEVTSGERTVISRRAPPR